MDIARIDYWAASGKSIMHRASVPSKTLATAAVIATVIVSSYLPLLAALYLMVLISVRAAGLPVGKVMVISVLPGLFALLFALSKLGGGLLIPVIILLKAFTAASAMILLFIYHTLQRHIGLCEQGDAQGAPGRSLHDLPFLFYTFPADGQFHYCIEIKGRVPTEEVLEELGQHRLRRGNTFHTCL